ncbi:Homeotic protein spalt-major [Schistosoma japonicum]|nr:Homeotic protein spalt-major [Schistosoma japonicum]
MHRIQPIVADEIPLNTKYQKIMLNDNNNNDDVMNENQLHNSDYNEQNVKENSHFKFKNQTLLNNNNNNDDQIKDEEIHVEDQHEVHHNEVVEHNVEAMKHENLKIINNDVMNSQKHLQHSHENNRDIISPIELIYENMKTSLFNGISHDSGIGNSQHIEQINKDITTNEIINHNSSISSNHFDKHEISIDDYALDLTVHKLLLDNHVDKNTSIYNLCNQNVNNEYYLNYEKQRQNDAIGENQLYGYFRNMPMNHHLMNFLPIPPEHHQISSMISLTTSTVTTSSTPPPPNPKPFLSLSSGDRNVKLASNNKERPFVCIICDKRFSTKGNLKTHLGQHHETIEAYRTAVAIAMATGTALPRPPPMSSTTTIPPTISLPPIVTSSVSVSNQAPATSSSSPSSASASSTKLSIDSSIPSPTSHPNHIDYSKLNDELQMTSNTFSLPWLPTNIFNNSSNNYQSRLDSNAYDFMLFDKGKENYTTTNHTTNNLSVTTNHFSHNYGGYTYSHQSEFPKSVSDCPISKCIDVSNNNNNDSNHIRKDYDVENNDEACEVANVSVITIDDTNNFDKQYTSLNEPLKTNRIPEYKLTIPSSASSISLVTEGNVNRSISTPMNIFTIEQASSSLLNPSFPLSKSTATTTTTTNTNTTTTNNTAIITKKDLFLDCTTNKFLSVANCL